MPGYKKHYFVWTDHQDKIFPKNVIRLSAKYKNWPDVSLKRFEMFLEQEEALKKYDYIYFLNANSYVRAPVKSEIFPSEDQGLTVVLHPGYWGKPNDRFSYDRNPKSTAYIPKGMGKYYVAGGFNGGRSEAFLKMSRILAENTRIDKKNGVMALWHDESHLNKYILDKNPLILLPNYSYWYAGNVFFKLLKGTAKIEIVEKGLPEYGGKNYLRGVTDEPNDGMIPEGSLNLIHPKWKDFLIPKNGKYYRFSRNDCGVIQRSDDEIIVIWDTYKPEKFIASERKGFYYYTEN